MEGYLGEFPVEISNSQYKDYTQSDWALLFIYMYGQIDGAHHKQWTLDQVTRILKNTKVIVTIAKWSNGHTEDRFKLDEPSEEYKQWVIDFNGEEDEDGNTEYSYDEGIAP